LGFPLLPQLSVAAELCIINLIAQHDPEPNPQFARYGDPGFSHSFLHQLATIEALQICIFLYCTHRRFRPQIAQQLVAFLGQFSQALSLSAAALAGNHPDMAGHLILVLVVGTVRLIGSNANNVFSNAASSIQ
jgi:hypothetical protein